MIKKKEDTNISTLREKRAINSQLQPYTGLCLFFRISLYLYQKSCDKIVLKQIYSTLSQANVREKESLHSQQTSVKKYSTAQLWIHSS